MMDITPDRPDLAAVSAPLVTLPIPTGGELSHIVAWSC